MAVIVNWRETKQSGFSFSLYDLGIVPSPSQSIQVTDLWTGEVVGTYNSNQARDFGVGTIAGHGNYSYRFTLVDSSVTEMLQ